MFKYDESDVRFAYELYDKKFKGHKALDAAKIVFQIYHATGCEEVITSIFVMVFEVELESRTAYLMTSQYSGAFGPDEEECILFDMFEDVLSEVEYRFSNFALDNAPKGDEKLYWSYRAGDDSSYDFTEDQKRVIYRINNKIYRGDC